MSPNEDGRTSGPETPAHEFRRSVEAARELLDGGQLLVFVPALGGIRFETEDAALEQSAERHGITADRLRAALQNAIPDLLWLAALEAPEKVVQAFVVREESSPEEDARAEVAEKYACVVETLLTSDVQRYARAKMKDDSVSLSDVRWTVLRPVGTPEGQPIARLVIKAQRGGFGVGPPPGVLGPGSDALGALFGRPATHTEVYCLREDVAYLIRQLEAVRAELVAAETEEDV